MQGQQNKWNNVLGLDLTLTSIFQFLPSGNDFMNMVYALIERKEYHDLICETARFGIWNGRNIFIKDMKVEKVRALIKFLVEQILTAKGLYQLPLITVHIYGSLFNDNSNWIDSHLIKGLSRMNSVKFKNINLQHNQLKLLLEFGCCKIEKLCFKNSHLTIPNDLEKSVFSNSTVKKLKIENDKKAITNYNIRTYIEDPFSIHLNASFSSLTTLVIDNDNYKALGSSLIQTNCKELHKFKCYNQSTKQINTGNIFNNVKEVSVSYFSTKEMNMLFPQAEKLNIKVLWLEENFIPMENVKELKIGTVSTEGLSLVKLMEEITKRFPKLNQLTFNDNIVKNMFAYKLSKADKEVDSLDILEFQYPSFTINYKKNPKNIIINHSKPANRCVLDGLKRELQMVCPSTFIDLNEKTDNNLNYYYFHSWKLINDIVPIELSQLREEICNIDLSCSPEASVHHELIEKYIACAYPVNSPSYVKRLQSLLNYLKGHFSCLTFYSEDIIKRNKETLEIYLALIGGHDSYSKVLEDNIKNLELIIMKYGNGFFKDLKLTKGDKEEIIECLNNIKVITNQIHANGHSIFPNKKLFFKEQWHSDELVDCFDNLQYQEDYSFVLNEEPEEECIDWEDNLEDDDMDEENFDDLDEEMLDNSNSTFWENSDLLIF
ncbi:hypothetical protein ABK040_003132 [Willaertia magna]